MRGEARENNHKVFKRVAVPGRCPLERSLVQLVHKSCVLLNTTCPWPLSSALQGSRDYLTKALWGSQASNSWKHRLKTCPASWVRLPSLTWWHCCQCLVSKGTARVSWGISGTCCCHFRCCGRDVPCFPQPPPAMQAAGGTSLFHPKRDWPLQDQGNHSKSGAVSSPWLRCLFACMQLCSGSFSYVFQGSCFTLQGSWRQQNHKAVSGTWLTSSVQPGVAFAALACTQVLPGTCLRAFFHGKGYTGHFSCDLTLASAVSHQKPGSSGAEAELAEPMERPPKPLGPAWAPVLQGGGCIRQSGAQ